MKEFQTEVTPSAESLRFLSCSGTSKNVGEARPQSARVRVTGDETGVASGAFWVKMRTLDFLSLKGNH